jgi:hypothetical protein
VTAANEPAEHPRSCEIDRALEATLRCWPRPQTRLRLAVEPYDDGHEKLPADGQGCPLADMSSARRRLSDLPHTI